MNRSYTIYLFIYYTYAQLTNLLNSDRTPLRFFPGRRTTPMQRILGDLLRGDLGRSWELGMKIWKSYDGGAPKNKITENGPFIDDLPVINGDVP